MPAKHGGDEARGGHGAGMLRRLGEWCARHFVIVLVAWLVALVTPRTRSPTPWRSRRGSSPAPR